jgi:hypothetical protein
MLKSDIVYIFHHAFTCTSFKEMGKIGRTNEKTIGNLLDAEIVVVMQMDIFKNGIEGIQALKASFIFLLVQNGFYVIFGDYAQKIKKGSLDLHGFPKTVLARMLEYTVKQSRAPRILNQVFENNVFSSNQIVKKIRIDLNAVVNDFIAIEATGMGLVPVHENDISLFDL